MKRAIAAASVHAAGPTPSHGIPRLVVGAAVLLAIALAAVWSQGWLGRRSTLQAAVRFEVRLAETSAAPGLFEARIPGSQTILYLHPDAIVTNDDVAGVRVIARDDRYDIAVTFTDAGGEKMRQTTSQHLNQPLAILIDGDVVVAPVIRAVISNSAVITGQYTKAEADRIAAGMMIR